MQVFSLVPVIFASFLAIGSDGANILFMHPYVSYSHRVSLQPLANELATRGHSITYISPVKYAKSHPNIKDIVPESYAKFVLASINQQFNIQIRVQKLMPVIYSIFDEILQMTCESLYSSPEFRDWLSTNPKIDLIVVDYHPDCAAALAYRLNAKVIIYNTLAFIGKYVDSLGLPVESEVSTSLVHYKPDHMSFMDRIKLTLAPLGWSYYEDKLSKDFQAMVHEHINTTVPHTQQMLREKVDLVLTTGNYISEQPRSLPPMFVSVPGLHLEESNKPLPQSLEKFINSPNPDGKANDGFIYISFGTVVISSDLPQYVFDAFFGAIEQFPNLRFLWRLKGIVPAGVPKNLHIGEWFDQQAVLAHPRIKGFVSQGGRPSMQEALTKAVPMILLPVLGDQDYNSHRMEDIGSGMVLEVGDVTKEQLAVAFGRTLTDEKLIASVKRNSLLFTDLPMKPLNLAVWWVEYAIRHKNLDHLKPLARNQTWYERRLLDVWFTLFTLAFSLILTCSITIYGIVKLISKFISRSSPTTIKSKQS